MRPRLDSILIRIVLLQLATLVVIAAALYGASRWLLSSDVVQFERRSLLNHAKTLATAVKVEADGTIKLELPRDLREFYDRGLGGLAYAVTTTDGKVIEATRSTERLELMGNPKAGDPVYFQSSDRRESFLGISVPVRIGTRDIWVQVTRKIRHPDMVTGDVVAFFLAQIGWYAIPIVLFVFAGSVWMMRRMLRPINAVSQLAAAIDPTRLDMRLPANALPHEIVPLVKAVNTSLGNLERSFHLQREFTAHAAHELRTPLSILRMQIDNMADRTTADNLREDADAMSHIVEQLLSAAEFEGVQVGPGEFADLHKVCSDVIAFMAPMALAQDKDLALGGREAPLILRGNEQMLYQAVRNLVENALKYSPPGTCVEIALDPEGRVLVMDRGPGVPEEERQLIFRRFWRGDRSKTNGAGLGLAIVARVAEAHGGTVSVADRPGGGSIFCLDLRPAPGDGAAR